MLRRRPQPVISRGVAAAFGLTLAVVGALLAVPLIPGQGNLREGDIAPRDLHARQTVTFASQVQTEEARLRAEQTVREVLVLDAGVLEEQLQKVDRVFDQVRSVRGRSDLTLQQQLAQLEQTAPASTALTPAARSALLALDRAGFETALQRVRDGLTAVLGQPARQEEIPGRIASFLDGSNLAAGSNDRVAVGEILRAFAVPNFRVDAAETALRRANARANVQPVEVSWAKGQVVVKQGEVLDAARIEALRKTGVLDDTFDQVADVIAGVVAGLGLGVLLGVFAYHLQPSSTSLAARRVLLAALAVVIVLVAVRVALPGLLPDSDGRYFAYAIPIAAAAMITASLLELHFAAIVAVAVGLFGAFIATTSPELAGADFLGPTEAFELVVVYVASGLAGAVVVHRAERFSRYAVAGVVVALVSWCALAIFWLLAEDRTNEGLAWLSLAAAVNGLGAAVLTIGGFIFLSMALGVTTRLQLMELGQADHPLLRRLQDEAPGTYHHSMTVGTLAERAAARIGADALVTRVGAYYHDIGKIAQPQYYIENMLDGTPSPHESLSPPESAARILEHVTNGLDLARRHHLPAIVRDFIPEHHGTRLVTYFYRRGVQQGGVADPEAFRYRGPRPQSKESGIVMLADSCEALVRAGGEAGRQKLDELVDSVFAERLAEGQLDECDITMRELQEVAASFKATLRAIYHPRIEYPAPTPEELDQLGRGAEGPIPLRRPAGRASLHGARGQGPRGR
jgi:putative nucleotidyltransferase with HDIG domain